ISYSPFFPYMPLFRSPLPAFPSPLSSSQGSSDVSFSLSVSDDEAPLDLLLSFPIFLFFSLSFFPSISLDFMYDNTFFALLPHSYLIFFSYSAEASNSLFKLIFSLSFFPSISLYFMYDNTFFALPPRSSLIFCSESAEASQSLWKLIASSTGSSLESLASSLSLSV